MYYLKVASCSSVLLYLRVHPGLQKATPAKILTAKDLTQTELSASNSYSTWHGKRGTSNTQRKCGEANRHRWHGKRGSTQRKRGEANRHRCHRWRGGRCLCSHGSGSNRSSEIDNSTAAYHHLARVSIIQRWCTKRIVIASQGIISGATSHGVANLSCHRSRRRSSITVERQRPNTFNRGRINSAEFCVL